MRSSTVGLIRPRTTRNGATRKRNGPPLRREIRPRGGRVLVLGIWNEPNHRLLAWDVRGISDTPGYAIRRIRRALPAPKSAAQTRRAAATIHRNFLEHCLRGTNFATGKSALPSISFPSTPKVRRPIPNDQCAHGNLRQLPNDRRCFRMMLLSLSLKANRSSSGSPIPKAARLARDLRSPTATGRCIPATRPRCSLAIRTGRRHGSILRRPDLGL